MSPFEFLLIALGFAVGAYGTMIGAGGVFVLVPALLFLFPDYSQREITAVSLAVVLMTSVSGAAAYARRRLIDYKTGLLLAAAMVPASFAGAYAVRLLPRSLFDVAFGVLLISLAVFSLAGALERRPTIREPVAPRRTIISRTLNRGGGVSSHYSYDLRQGLGMSGATGFVAALFGVGGGILQVPLMTTVLRIPLDVSVATTQLMLIFMAAAGTAVHALSGSFELQELTRAALLGIGAIPGAQVGAAISRRLTSKAIARLLSAGLIAIGGGLIIAPLV